MICSGAPPTAKRKIARERIRGPRPTSRQADVIILGAGPAGYSSAIAACQAGLRPILLEMKQSGKQQPGETLHPGIEPILKQLGVWEQFCEQGFHRHRGIWRESQDNPRRFVPYGESEDDQWLGFQVDRLRFRDLLRARVIHLYGTIVQVARLEGVTLRDSAISGIRADGCNFKAGFVLDATGRRSWLAQELGLNPERKPPLQRLRFGWTEETAAELKGQPLFRERKNGWDWLAPLGDGRCAWARLRRGPGSSGIDFTWQIFRECAGPGYFLLGDAACLMDPSAANGVLRALMSGMYAVHLIRAVRQETSLCGRAAHEYRGWIGEMFDGALAQSAAILTRANALPL